jgi:hypothetical protein
MQIIPVFDLGDQPCFNTVGMAIFR